MFRLPNTITLPMWGPFLARAQRSTLPANSSVRHSPRCAMLFSTLQPDALLDVAARRSSRQYVLNKCPVYRVYSNNLTNLVNPTTLRVLEWTDVHFLSDVALAKHLILRRCFICLVEVAAYVWQPTMILFMCVWDIKKPPIKSFRFDFNWIETERTLIDLYIYRFTCSFAIDSIL